MRHCRYVQACTKQSKLPAPPTLALLAGVFFAALPAAAFAFFVAFFSLAFSSRSRFRFAASRFLAAYPRTELGSQI